MSPDFLPVGWIIDLLDVTAFVSPPSDDEIGQVVSLQQRHDGVLHQHQHHFIVAFALDAVVLHQQHHNLLVSLRNSSTFCLAS